MPAVFLPKQLIDSRELSAGMRADPQAVIETAEERYRRDIEALARSLADSGCSVAMLSGPSASGKTTYRKMIIRRDNPVPVPNCVGNIFDRIISHRRIAV